MCLQQCPTYSLTRDEGESPRGRISLIQGLIAGQIPYSEQLNSHLGNCLKCRACERICPSMVPYGELIDAAQTYIEVQHHRPSFVRKLLLSLATQRSLLGAFAEVLRTYQRSGLQRLIRATRFLKIMGLERLERQLPRLQKSAPWKDYYPSVGTHRGDVALFVGCIADIVDRSTSEAAIKILTRLGYGVRIPPAQQCCGALHLHNGDPERAWQLAQANIAAFRSENIVAIVSTASGCGATLSEYDAPSLGGELWKQKVYDVSSFLAKVDWSASITLRPLNRRIAIHDPCSLNHVMRQAGAAHELLRRIPGVELAPLNQPSQCCGAAGSYMVTHPETAARLREVKLANIDSLRVQTLATSNIGCALHLAAGLREAGQSIEVVHPVVLVASQLD